MVTIILCGGIGSRLWPISRELFPKQFITLFEGESLFQQTLKRNFALSESIYVITHLNHYHTACNQAQETLRGNTQKISFLLEETQKNTAFALSLACLSLEGDVIVLSVPSDHLIRNETAYQKAIKKAIALAEKDCIVTFGIKPMYPETGFGYIQHKGDKVLSFTEKPSIEKAKYFCKDGNFLWNSGMFCFRVGFFLQELQHYAPHIYEMAQEYKHILFDGQKCFIGSKRLKEAKDESIDYALIEKSKRIKVVETAIEWSDIGSFEGIYAKLPHDEHNNGIYNTQNKPLQPVLLNAHNNLILQSNRQIALIDIDDIMIVDTPDALLIAKKGSGQKVKEVIKELDKQQCHLRNTLFCVHRPWGTFMVLEEGESYKIKSIEVFPSKRLSLQKHFHRSEHWIVISGTAVVQLGDKEVILRPNESTYIPAGEIHRLSNPGKIPLIVIEVQIGAYLAEDDIVRLDDDYCRENL